MAQQSNQKTANPKEQIADMLDALNIMDVDKVLLRIPASAKEYFLNPLRELKQYVYFLRKIDIASLPETLAENLRKSLKNIDSIIAAMKAEQAKQTHSSVHADNLQKNIIFLVSSFVSCSIYLLFESKPLGDAIENVITSSSNLNIINEQLKTINEVVSTAKSDAKILISESHSEINVMITKEQGEISRLKAELVSAEKLLTDKISEIEDYSKQIAATLATQTFVDDFRKQEQKYKSSSKWWFAFTLIMLTATLFSSYHFFVQSFVGENMWQAIHFIGVRIIGIGLLLSATIWCARMYTLLYQQMLVNNHRALSIKTLVPFLDTVNSKEAQDAIVLQATKAIYETENSGIVNATPDVSVASAYNEIAKLIHK